MMIHIILWPMLLIMDRHNFSKGMVRLSHEISSREEEEEICVQRTQPVISQEEQGMKEAPGQVKKILAKISLIG
jgi:hypothetical protein